MIPNVEKKQNNIAGWIFAAILLVIAIAIFYPKIASLGGCLLTGDHKEQHYPWARFLSESLAKQELPWWTWKIHCGFPLLAEGQIAAFYPPNFLLSLVCPVDTAYSLNFILHMFLSGLFFLMYCRNTGLGWTAAAVGGMAYLFGNAFGGAYYNITSLKTLAWFPLSLMLIDRLWARRTLRLAVALGCVFALQLLAGYLQIAAYSIAMAALYFVLRLFFREGLQLRWWNPFTGVGLFLVTMVVTGVLFLPQFLATYPLSQLSCRVGLEESFAYLGSFPPWGMLTLLFPKLEGLLRTLGIYVGILPLFLVILSFAHWEAPAVQRWGLMLILSLLLAMGQWSPLYVGLVRLTHFYGFRVPSKLLFFSNTALAVMAAWGMEALLKSAFTDRAWKIARTIFFAIGTGAIALGACGGFLLDAFRSWILNWGYGWVEKYIYAKPYHLQSLEYYRQGVDSYYQMAREMFRVTDPRMAVSLVTIAVVLAALRLMKPRWPRGVLAGCCLLLVSGDLYAYHFTNKLVGDQSFYAKEMAPSPAAMFLRQDSSRYRIFGYHGRFEDISLVPSVNMLFGIEDIGAYSPFVLKSYRDLLEGLGAVDDSTGRIVEDPQGMLAKLPMLSMMNVKYILTPKAVVLPGLSKVFESSTEAVYQNPHVQDRFFFAQQAQFSEDPAHILKMVRGMDLASTKVVWLEGPAALQCAPLEDEDEGKIVIREYSDSRILLEVEAPQTGGLVFGSILYYPGVIATLDGRPVKIFHANYCFCAVAVPPGRHIVTFAFDWRQSLGWPVWK